MIIGCVTETGEQGACIARAAVLAAGWPIEIPGVTLNRFCGSGQTAVNFAAHAVASGAHDVVYAGGVENMSRVPMGADMGPLPSSLTNRYDLVPQGLSAEMIAEQWNYSRRQLDEFALESQRRAWAAIQEGRFAKSLVPDGRDARGRERQALRDRRARPPADDARRPDGAHARRSSRTARSTPATRAASSTARRASCWRRSAR